MKFSLVNLIILLPFCSFCQPSLDLRAGINFGWLSNNLIEEGVLPHPGFNGQFRYNHKFKKKLVISSGLGFIQDGQDFQLIFTDNLGNEISESRIKTRFNKVIVPISLGYEFGQNVFIKPKIGITVDYTMTAVYKYPDGLIPNTTKIDFTNQVKPIYLSLFGGVEIAKTLEPIAVFGSLDFRHSLSHIYRQEFSNQDLQVRLMSFSMQLGCRFFLNSGSNLN